jgi:DNA processing protein
MLCGMLEFWLWAYSLEGVSSRVIERLYVKYGNDPDIKRVCTVLGTIAKRTVDRARWHDRAQEIQDGIARRGVRVIPFWDDTYPASLREIPDFPAFVFYRGNIEKLPDGPILSVVGTRKMTEYGRQCVREILGEIALYPLTVVSGLAYGIDGEAHRTILDCQTGNALPLAVLPGGPCGGYPHINSDLYESIAERGCILWEFLPGIEVKPELFAVRNRIIAGLSGCTLVVESPASGGSMITADLALQYGRDVAACPGSIFSDESVGANYLISRGAYVVSCARDVLEIINASGSGGKKIDRGRLVSQQLSLELSLSDARSAEVYRSMLEGMCTPDLLSKMTGKNAAQVRGCLTRLEVKGILRLDPEGKIKIEA